MSSAGVLVPGVLAARRRQELSKRPLQEWEPDFYTSMATYHRVVSQLLEKAASSGHIRDSDAYRRDLLQFRDLVGARMGKVLSIVGLMIQSDLPAPKELLPEERQLVEELLKVLSDFHARTFPLGGA